jgi:hypothetical protein
MDPDVDIDAILSQNPKKTQMADQPSLNNNDLSHHYRLDNSIYDIPFNILTFYDRKEEKKTLNFNWIIFVC